MDTVATGQKWASELTRMESRCSGDRENAWRRLANRYGIDPYTFWALRYRPPKDLAASVWLRLGAAYQSECERQKKRLEHEIEITRQITGPDNAAVAAAQAVVGTHEEEGPQCLKNGHDSA